MSNADLYRESQLAWHRASRNQAVPRIPISLRERLPEGGPVTEDAGGDPWNTPQAEIEFWQKTQEQAVSEARWFPCRVKDEATLETLKQIAIAVVKNDHKKSVAAAIQRGENVPDEVMAGYPDLEKGQ